MNHGDTHTVVRGIHSAAEPVAALSNRLRRELYEYVRTRQGPVSRDEVAEHASISARLAAFHLDTLVCKGLLQASYARKPGRSGPGAGRSSKFYQPSGMEIDVSVPERRYDLLGDILLAAIDGTTVASAREAALRIAFETGQQLGEQARQGPDPDAQHTLHTLEAVGRMLSGYGFEPRPEGTDALTLNNCPFHALACRNSELVCRINQGLIEGILHGLRTQAVQAALEPTPGQCCVKLRTHGRDDAKVHAY